MTVVVMTVSREMSVAKMTTERPERQGPHEPVPDLRWRRVGADACRSRYALSALGQPPVRRRADHLPGRRECVHRRARYGPVGHGLYGHAPPARVGCGRG